MLELQAVTSSEPNAALAAVRHAVQAEGGWISSHEIFDNASAGLTFEIAGERIAQFVDRLVMAEIRVFEDIGEYGQLGKTRCSLTLAFIGKDRDTPG